MPELLPADNLDGFTPIRDHPIAPGGYPVAVGIHRVGQQLQAYRLASGLGLGDVATTLEWSASKVSRIETGDVGISISDARALLAVHGVTDPEEIDALLTTVRENRKQRKPNPYADVISPKYQRYLEYEAAATGISLYAPVVVPDIFQTAGYAAEMDAISHPEQDTNERELLARLRRERADCLLGNLGERALHLILREEALHRGKTDELRLIIGSLKRLCTAGRQQSPSGVINSNITIQVAPYASGHSRLGASAYSILHIDDQQSATYIPGPTDGTSIFDPTSATTSEYQDALSELANAIPAPEHTNDILDAILANLPS